MSPRRPQAARRGAGLPLLFALAAACSATRPPGGGAEPCAAPHEAFVRHELYIGMSIPGGGAVTDSAWSAFAAEVLTPRFPAGMTVVDASGEWLGDDGTRHRERTRVVSKLAPLTDAAADDAVEAVIAEAKRRFEQQSVLWQRSVVCAAF